VCVGSSGGSFEPPGLQVEPVDWFLNAQSISIIHCQFYMHSRKATSHYYCTINIIAYFILLLKWKRWTYHSQKKTKTKKQNKTKR